MAVRIDQPREERDVAEIMDLSAEGFQFIQCPYGSDAPVSKCDRAIFDGRGCDGNDPPRTEDSRCLYLFALPSLVDQMPASCLRRLPLAASLTFRALNLLCRLRICCSIFFITRSMAA